MDPGGYELSGIVNLIRRNDARHVHLRLNSFDPGAALEAGKDWPGTVPGLTEEGFTWTVRNTEALLIRIAVRLGVPIANSQLASQWEAPIETMHDRLAVWAVTAQRKCVTGLTGTHWAPGWANKAWPWGQWQTNIPARGQSV